MSEEELTCDLSRDKTVCHFGGKGLGDVVLEWWGIFIAIAAFIVLALPEAIILYRNSFGRVFSSLLVPLSISIRTTSLVLESWAFASLIMYLYSYPFSCELSDHDNIFAAADCSQSPECLEKDCSEFKQSSVSLELVTLLVFAVVAYIPKTMAACAEGRQFRNIGFEDAFWELVSDRGCCWSGWILIVLPYITAATLVLTTVGVGESGALIGTSWQDSLEITIRLLTSFVIFFLGCWTFYIVALSACTCFQDMEEIFARTVKVIQISQLTVDVLAAFLFLGTSYLAGTFFMTAEAVLLGFGLTTSCCCHLSESEDESVGADSIKRTGVDDEDCAEQIFEDEEDQHIIRETRQYTAATSIAST